MSKLVDKDRLAKLAKALDDRSKAGDAANAEAIAQEVEDREAAIAQEVEDREAAIDEAVTFENGITTVNALGGIAAGTSLDGKSVTEILDMLLFPYVKQTISNVKGTPNGGTFEHGNNQTITAVQATVTKKSKKITKVNALVDPSTDAPVSSYALTFN